MSYLKRKVEEKLREYLDFYPAVAILGPRQCGKSTLAKKILENFENSIYLDLELISDRAKLQNSEYFFEYNKDKLICLDEIQRMPEIFPLLRALIDRHRISGRFLILGSASRDLIQQSSESLAGRIGFIELSPFIVEELPDSKNLEDYWVNGGLPLSYLAQNKFSLIWRQDFIRTFLERDIPQLGFNIPTEIIQRLWRMLSHHHGQILNLSQLGMSLGVSHTTIKNYIEILIQTFMIRELKPYLKNIGKRMVKTPKIYLRDSGILHSLLGIDDFNQLMGHPVAGYSWEGLVIENVCQIMNDWQASFYRTSHGVEIDLILEKGDKCIAIECKMSAVSSLTKGFWSAIEDVKPNKVLVVAPVNEAYPIRKNIWVCDLKNIAEHLLL